MRRVGVHPDDRHLIRRGGVEGVFGAADFFLLLTVPDDDEQVGLREHEPADRGVGLAIEARLPRADAVEFKRREAALRPGAGEQAAEGLDGIRLLRFAAAEGAFVVALVKRHRAAELIAQLEGRVRK